MGHHTIQEVSQEKFEFQGRAKLIPLLLIVLGAVMAVIGSMQVKNNWDIEDSHHSNSHTEEVHEAHADEHSMNAIKTVSLNDNPNTESIHTSEGHEAHADEHHGPTWMTRVWANLLMNSYYFWLFAVGAC